MNETHEDTLFTKIVKREIPATIVYEDEESLAFMDIHPIAKGHLLLITKEPYRWMQDVPDELLGRMFIKAKKLMGAMKTATGSDMVHSIVEGKEVPHFHIKLIPDMMSNHLATWQLEKYEDGEMQTYADKIKSAL
ncbi:MAG TPA: HIT family protein [Candidatus Paceibacterota bacterium]|nr:HIT family protein [Candidatus Paceibacterota bacterium]